MCPSLERLFFVFTRIEGCLCPHRVYDRFYLSLGEKSVSPLFVSPVLGYTRIRGCVSGMRNPLLGSPQNRGCLIVGYRSPPTIQHLWRDNRVIETVDGSRAFGCLRKSVYECWRCTRRSRTSSPAIAPSAVFRRRHMRTHTCSATSYCCSNILGCRMDPTLENRPA